MPFVLDETKPLDTDLASAGAGEIRTTRSQLKGSFDTDHTFADGFHRENTARIGSGLESAKPAASRKGRLWYSTDQAKLWYDTGAAWTLITEEKLRWFIGPSDGQTAAADGVLRDIPSLSQMLVASGEPMNFRTTIPIWVSGTSTGWVKLVVAFVEDATEIARAELGVPAGVNVPGTLHIDWIRIPSAASHTFKVQWAGVKSVGGDSVVIATGAGAWNGSLPVPRMMLIQEIIGNAV